MADTVVGEFMQTMAMNGSSIDFVNVWTFGRIEPADQSIP